MIYSVYHASASAIGANRGMVILKTLGASNLPRILSLVLWVAGGGWRVAGGGFSRYIADR
jgi:hypothetical protein